MRKFFSFSHLTAGFIAVMIGFTSSVVLIFQGAALAGANAAEVSSWLFALGISIAICCIGFSFYYRMPILVGWSTPGAAFIATSLAHVPMNEAIGAFIFASLLTMMTGLSGMLEKIMIHIPKALTSAMLAGILFHFGVEVFNSLDRQYFLVMGMLLTYFIGKKVFPRSVILFVMVVGICIAKTQNLFHIDNFSIALPTPILVTPHFSLATLFGIGLPLFILTMTSQNVPGIAVLNSLGYAPRLSPLVSWMGLANCIFAPLGCYSIGLTAFTAAICGGEDVDENPKQRYKATIIAGFFWVCVALFGATIYSLFFALPKELILAITGIALFGTIANSLKHALDDDRQREPALITMLVSSSNLHFFGVSAACWGLIAGILAHALINGFRRHRFSAVAS